MASEFVYKFVPASGSETTLLLLHGTGGDENDLVPVGRGTAKGAAMLSPRGRVDENGMARFFRRVREGVFDEESIHKEAAALEGFVRDAAREHGFDPTRVIAFGYSNGANMAAALMLLYPKLLAGAVLLRATIPLTPEPLLGAGIDTGADTSWAARSDPTSGRDREAGPDAELRRGAG